ncbi:MAG: hypothetical protein RLY14_2120 [Planctomycetota bacterium]|jgi:hypothetical protein
MNDNFTIRESPIVTTKGMIIGGIVGALIGAVIRGGITFYHLREGEVFGLLASLPSASIGFLCGAIAGCWCRGSIGALIGALLSAGVFGLFFLPFAYVLSLFDAADKATEFAWPLFLQKAIAGGIAGGVGGLVGRWITASEKKQ